MSKCSALTGIAFGTCSVLLVIIGLATTNWIKGCVPFSALFDDLAGAFAGPGDSFPGGSAPEGRFPESSITDTQSFPNSLELTKQIYAGHDLCISLGLFQIGVDVGIAKSSVAIDVDSQESFVVVTIALLLFGVILMAIGLTLLTIGSAHSSFKVSKFTAPKLLCVGLAVIVLATLSLLVAMVLYTTEQRDVLGSPFVFFTQVQAGFTSALAGLFSAPGQNPIESSDINSPPAFGSGPNFGNPGLPPDFTDLGHSDYSDFFHIGNTELNNSVDGNAGFGNPGLEYTGFGAADFGSNNPSEVTGFGKFFNAFSIEFAYSFILAWIGLACAVFACVFGGIAILRQLRHSNNSNESIPMK